MKKRINQRTGRLRLLLGASLALVALAIHSAPAKAQTTDPVQVPSGCVANTVDRQLACGQGAVTSGESLSTAVGINAESGRGSAAFGTQSIATGSRSTALGINAQTGNNNDAVAVGTGAYAGTNGTALGAGANASNTGSIAVGKFASVGLDVGQYSIAMGSGGVAIAAAHAQGNFSVAIGSGDGATANGAYSNSAFGVAIGTGSIAQNQYDAAFGAFAIATGTRSAAFGANAVAGGTSSVAMGDGAFASGGNAASIGLNSVASGANSVAMGAQAAAAGSNSVAIGSRSIATEANTVSFGGANNERRLTNVAPGINQTDAVNMGQLSSVAGGLQTQIFGLQSQISGLQTQITGVRTEARRGIAAAVATASPPMPSAPGKTTWQMRGSTFQNEYGVGFGFAHRLRTAMPLNVVGGYGNGGGVEHTAYVGLGGEF